MKEILERYCGNCDMYGYYDYNNFRLTNRLNLTKLLTPSLTHLHTFDSVEKLELFFKSLL